MLAMVGKTLKTGPSCLLIQRHEKGSRYELEPFPRAVNCGAFVS